MSLLARVRWPLCAVVAVLCTVGLGVELWHGFAPSTVSDALLPRFSLSFEGNVPTWLSSALLLACALLSADIASAPTMNRTRTWWGAAAAFTWASLDETAEIHENLGGVFRTGGVLYFDWVVPASLALLALAFVFWPWFRALPSATRRRLAVAWCVYFTGALLMELPLGWWTERAGADSLGYALLDWVEETLEFVGIVMMLLALLAHREAGAAPASEPRTAPRP
jgi:hypothetical protein